MRLSIGVTPKQHQKLKAAPLSELETFLESRIDAAQGETVHKSVEQIFEETYQEEPEAGH